MGAGVGVSGSLGGLVGRGVGESVGRGVGESVGRAVAGSTGVAVKVGVGVGTVVAVEVGVAVGVDQDRASTCRIRRGVAAAASSPVTNQRARPDPNKRDKIKAQRPAIKTPAIKIRGSFDSFRTQDNSLNKAAGRLYYSSTGSTNCSHASSNSQYDEKNPKVSQVRVWALLLTNSIYLG